MARINSRVENGANRPRADVAPEDGGISYDELRAMRCAAIGINAEDNPDAGVVCALYKPARTPADERTATTFAIEQAYMVAVCAGRPAPSDVGSGWKVYPWTNASYGHTTHGSAYCFTHSSTFDASKAGAIPWVLPAWAVSVIRTIMESVERAYRVGYDNGTEDGIATGKSFVRMLASGEVSVNDFEAEGRDALQNRHRPIKARW